MTDENVQVVRGYFEALNRWLAAYWSDPEQPIEQVPGLDEVDEHLAPDAEWDWLFTPETFRGRDQILQAVSDWLETVSDWRVEVDELVDGRQHRVMVVGRVIARGKGSGAPIRQPLFTAVTVQDGKVARIEDHTDRASGLQAAGLTELSRRA
jgi:ketosteroid isomerase-like protein